MKHFYTVHMYTEFDCYYIYVYNNINAEINQKFNIQNYKILQQFLTSFNFLLSTSGFASLAQGILAMVGMPVKGQSDIFLHG